MMRDSKLEPLSREATACLGLGVRKAARTITQIYDHALAPAGLKSTQFSLLNAAFIADGASINRLAELLAMDRTTLTRNLKPLENGGLIEVVSGADRRTRTIRVTPHGRTALKRALPLWRDIQNRTAKRLGETRRDRLRRDLKVVAELGS